MLQGAAVRQFEVLLMSSRSMFPMLMVHAWSKVSGLNDAKTPHGAALDHLSENI